MYALHTSCNMILHMFTGKQLTSKKCCNVIGLLNNAINVMALVVAQSVEQQHSVQAGRVQIPAQAKLLGSELLFINTHWVSGFL